MPVLPRRAAVLAGLLLLGTLGAAGPVAAHTELVSTSPTNGAVLATSPTKARLVFNEKVTPDAEAIVLRSRAGEEVATGAPYRSGTTVIVPITEALTDGSYLLSYAVSSADQHTVKGSVAFRVRR